jgi:hypothetical protein
MPKQNGSLAPVALLVALAVIIPAANRADAAADCAAAPSAQAPQGTHWYYRTDHATGRKCWYASPESRKGHGQVPQNLTARAQPPSEESLATSSTAGDPLTPTTQIGQSPTLTWPETTAGDMQAVVASPRSADAIKPEQAVSAPVEQGRTTTDARVASEQPEVPTQRPAATTAKMANLLAITPVSILLLVVSVLAVVGIFLRPIFQSAPRRQPSPRHVKNDLAVVIAAARRAASPLPPPYSPRDYAGGRAPSGEEPSSSRAKPRHRLEDVEDALLGVLRDWERPTASAN